MRTQVVNHQVALQESGGPRIDVFIVFFRLELEMLLLQARSFEKYADPAFVNSIHIVFNGDNYSEVERYVVLNVLPAYGAIMASRCFVHQASDLLKESWDLDGWNVQQALKLRGHAVCSDA